MTDPKPARRTVSAQEKAREALGVAERRLKRLEDESHKHASAINTLAPQIAEAKATRDYLAQHPALRTVDGHRPATEATS